MNRAGSFSLLVTTTHYHNAEYRNVNPEVFPHFLLGFSRLVSSLGITDRHSDNLQTRCYCFQHHVVFSTKSCVFTVLQNLVAKKITSSSTFLGIFPLKNRSSLLLVMLKIFRVFCCCFVFEMLLYFQQFWSLNEYFKQALLTLRCKYSSTKSHKSQFVNNVQ